MRSVSKKKEYACGKYYNTLSFKCTFPEIQMLKTQNPQWPGIPKEEETPNTGVFEVGPNDPGAPGCVMCFAYALPYTYCDLLSDLEMSKKFLLAHGGNLVNQ